MIEDLEMLGKQAKILTDKQAKLVLAAIQGHRYPLRDKVMFLLSTKAGMRAKEVASVTWSMVMDAEGNIGEVIALQNKASKGKGGGRIIPMHPMLREAIIQLHAERGEKATPDRPVIHSERDRGLSPGAVAVWFHRLYQGLGLIGCSSHSGRRTFITNAARKVSQVGGSLRDVQQLAGHSNLATTSRYIDTDTDAQRKLVGMI